MAHGDGHGASWAPAGVLDAMMARMGLSGQALRVSASDSFTAAAAAAWPHLASKGPFDASPRGRLSDRGQDLTAEWLPLAGGAGGAAAAARCGGSRAGDGTTAVVAATASIGSLDLSGTWIKDKRASQSMDSALQLMGMRGIVRKALCLLRGMNISQTDTTVTFEVFSVLGWFKSVEKYSLAGEPSLLSRRDLRSGKQTGYVQMLLPKPLPAAPPAALLPSPRMQTAAASLTAAFGVLRPSADLPAPSAHDDPPGEHAAPSMAVYLSWGEPFGGTGLDVYELVDPNVLHLTSTLCVGGKQETCLSVFRRKGT